METEERIDSDAAYTLARRVKNDPDQSEQAREYAKAVEKHQLSGEALEIQLQYIAVNSTDEIKKEVSDILGYMDEDSEFIFGYCQICGTRDNDRAYTGPTPAHGLVCESCHEEEGDPEPCEECGTETYEGDTFIEGPREGEFYCDSCLLQLPNSGPEEA